MQKLKKTPAPYDGDQNVTRYRDFQRQIKSKSKIAYTDDQLNELREMQ